ncbi:MAG: hypothetical protein AAFP09_00005 [Cyanobacteria bacterium J06607_10]
MVRLPVSIQMRIAKLAPRTLSKNCVTGLALTLTLAVAGCATAPDKAVVEPAEPDAVELPSEPIPPAVEEDPDDKVVEAQPDGEGTFEKQPGGSDAMVSVSVYTIDDQCNDFVEETIQVPADQAMFQAVGKAVDSVDANEFKLEDYRVVLEGNTAVVDMSLADGSERQFVSLSSCEQRALFGSVEETLLNNPDWAVDAVKFTNAGEELVL